MKKIVKTPKTVERVVEKVIEETSEVVDIAGGPLDLLGKVVYVSCSSYAYTGKLSGVNDKFIELEEPSIVFETGAFTASAWKDAQRLPCKKTLIFFAQIEQMFEVVRS